jgi:hypothetical protein
MEVQYFSDEPLEFTMAQWRKNIAKFAASANFWGFYEELSLIHSVSYPVSLSSAKFSVFFAHFETMKTLERF